MQFISIFEGSERPALDAETFLGRRPAPFDAAIPETCLACPSLERGVNNKAAHRLLWHIKPGYLNPSVRTVRKVAHEMPLQSSVSEIHVTPDGIQRRMGVLAAALATQDYRRHIGRIVDYLLHEVFDTVVGLCRKEGDRGDNGD